MSIGTILLIILVIALLGGFSGIGGVNIFAKSRRHRVALSGEAFNKRISIVVYRGFI